MSYNRISADLLKVPGKMDVDEMAYLAALASMVPAGGRIIEVGPFYGRSTNAMARANPEALITSIDTFEDVEWTDRYASQYQEIPKFGRDAFDHFTKDLPNVTAIQGFSPDVVSDWSDPVDMYFEDAIHGNPGLKANMDFWIDRLKPGGIVCGHDYTMRFPDIKREADAWAKTWGAKLEVVGSLWAIRKPIPDERESVTARGLRPRLQSQPELKVRTSNRRAGSDKTADGYWCGAHLEHDPLKWVMVDPLPKDSGLTLEYRVGHPKNGTSDWMPAGEKARLLNNGKPMPFTRLAMRLTANDGQNAPHVMYRVSTRQFGNGGYKISGTSQWAHDGEWAHYAVESAAANAITVTLADEPPADVQSAFTPKPGTKPRALLQKIKKKVLATR
jgi:predicted O-methyltransferase YrrM